LDPVQLGTAAVAVLAPYLTSLAGKVGERVAETVAGKAATGTSGVVEALYDAVRRKFAADGDKDAQGALTSLEAKPDSESRQAVMAEVLADKARADEGFGDELSNLVQQAARDQPTMQFLTQVYGNAKVKSIVTIGSARDITIQ
jgi:hypothetical protein